MNSVSPSYMTVDVEEYFQVEAFAKTLDAKGWDQMESRLEWCMDRVLTLFDDAGIKATFFVLGWIGERHPAVIRRLVAAGHELASHGYGHDKLEKLDRESFAADIRRAKAVLEEVGGVAIKGYRAPCFSITPDNDWAHDEILAAGHSYSSSVFPIRHDLYGAPLAPRTPFRLANGLIEIPATTARHWGRNWPAAGGGFFRLLPYPVFSRLWQSARDQGVPNIFYFHPWEVDPQQPRVANAPWRSRFRHYLNLDKTEPRLRLLLQRQNWQRLDTLAAQGAFPLVSTWPEAATGLTGCGCR